MQQLIQAMQRAISLGNEVKRPTDRSQVYDERVAAWSAAKDDLGRQLEAVGVDPMQLWKALV